jgi:hypothetical protein
VEGKARENWKKSTGNEDNTTEYDRLKMLQYVFKEFQICSELFVK